MVIGMPIAGTERSSSVWNKLPFAMLTGSPSVGPVPGPPAVPPSYPTVDPPAQPPLIM